MKDLPDSNQPYADETSAVAENNPDYAQTVAYIAGREAASRLKALPPVSPVFDEPQTKWPARFRLVVCLGLGYALIYSPDAKHAAGQSLAQWLNMNLLEGVLAGTAFGLILYFGIEACRGRFSI